MITIAVCCVVGYFISHFEIVRSGSLQNVAMVTTESQVLQQSFEKNMSSMQWFVGTFVVAVGVLITFGGLFVAFPFYKLIENANKKVSDLEEDKKESLAKTEDMRDELDKKIRKDTADALHSLKAQTSFQFAQIAFIELARMSAPQADQMTDEEMRDLQCLSALTDSFHSFADMSEDAIKSSPHLMSSISMFKEVIKESKALKRESMRKVLYKSLEHLCKIKIDGDIVPQVADLQALIRKITPHKI